jgi:RNA polymerase sigma-70 factor, ECF subfamily
MRSDESIIRRVLGGHAGEFRELMLRYQGRAYTVSYRILCRREDAEDVVQDTFLRVYRNLSTYREQDRFWPWLRRIAVNCCLERLRRKQSREQPDDFTDESLGIACSAEEEALRNVTLEMISDAVAELPERLRIVMVLRYQEELSYKEIAELIGEPQTTVQVRLYRARKMVSRKLVVLDGV